MEDLLLADQQISIELNSSCDNPLVDSQAQEIYYGCNFQAASVTSAMEKVRLSLQMFGRILFAQSTEMIDPHLSGGLPANLAADDPSLSFTMKGIDINMAAYMAELSYVANPMSSHVQTAEMHNQSVNSMALASARMSHTAIDILTNMSACSVYITCQALDLRALHMEFVRKAIEIIKSLTTSLFPTLDPKDMEALIYALEIHIGPAWGSTGKLDLFARCESLVNSAIPIVAVSLAGGVVSNVLEWKEQTTKAVYEVWTKTFDAFTTNPHTVEVLGKGSQALYRFVRHELAVPFHEGFVEHPTHNIDKLHGRAKKTIGGWVSIIHESIRNGSLSARLMTVVEKELLRTTNGLNGEHGKTHMRN